MRLPYGVIVLTDTTDHIAFACPACNFTMNVTNVVTSKGKIDKATYIYLFCSKCNKEGVRKFYHDFINLDNSRIWMKEKKSEEL